MAETDDVQIVVDALPMMFFEKDINNVILRTNRAVADALGVAVSDLIGSATNEWFPDEAGAYYADDLEVIASGVSKLGIVEQLQTGDGSKLWIQTDKVPRFDSDGKVVGILVFIRDAEALAVADEAITKAQRLESITALAGGVAHHLNNALMAIIGNVHRAMAAVGPDVPAYATLNSIARAANDASATCDELLTFAGQRHRELGAANLSEVIESTLRLIDVALPDQITIERDFDLDLPEPAIDCDMMRQVVANLVANAREALADESGVISVTTSLEIVASSNPEAFAAGTSLRPGAYVRLRVADSAGGIAPELLDRIFDPFVTTKFVGRGLGLASVLGAVRRHDGAIAVSTAVGSGTTIDVYLPASAPAEVDQAGERSVAAATRFTVLVVDDSDMVRELLALSLADAGYDVLEAASGAEAIEVFGQATIDVLVLDVAMPEMTGLDLYEQLIATNEGLPVIFSSGFAPNPQMSALLEHRSVEFLQKPFGQRELLGRLASVLQDPTAN